MAFHLHPGMNYTRNWTYYENETSLAWRLVLAILHLFTRLVCVASNLLTRLVSIVLSVFIRLVLTCIKD